MKPAVVRYYLDADVLGLAKLLVRVRPDVTYPGDPGGVLHKRYRSACPIGSTAVLDEVWIPETARQGLQGRGARVVHAFRRLGRTKRKRVFWALKDELEGDRPAGEPARAG